jgi:hypothetical protein
MPSQTTPTEPLDAHATDCRACQHRVDVPGVDQVVCLAHLAVFNRTDRYACQEFEPKSNCKPKPPAASADSPER